MLAWLLLAQAVQTARPVGGVEVKPGDSIIIHPAEDGTLTLISNHPGDAKPAAGDVRIDMREKDGQTYLTVMNNDPRTLRYAAIEARTNGRTGPTSVCAVMPDDKFAIEHWPYSIKQLMLYRFRRTDERGITCE